MAGIATSAIGTVLPKLAEVLKEEYQLQKTVKGEIMFLSAELERMQAALQEVSDSEAAAIIDGDAQSKLVKLWARDVRELSYDIEDTIDRFMVRVDKPRSFRGFIDRSLNLLTNFKIRHKIGGKIRDIKAHLKEVSERRDRYNLDVARVAKPVGQTVDSLRLQSALYGNVSDLVGTEKKTEDLIMMMNADEGSKQNLKVVSIFGFGGLGKTTLANLVYQNLKENFTYWAFVSVSLNPNLVGIFKNMLRQLDGEKYKNINGETWEEVELIEELRKFLQDKSYFIVIDDIWKGSVWQTIQKALIDNQCGSRIITTTRVRDVAKQIGGAYQLEPLSLDDSRKLFNQIIFHSKDKCPPYHLSEVSQKILKKCGGIPLAIITIASVLASKKGNEYVHWNRVYHSMGSGLEDNPDLSNMRRILSVSYYDLPPHLKTCLLYLSSYPEDYLIDRKTLIWQWVGEGFVDTKQDSSLYEVGGDYFDELMNKGMIQPAGDIVNNYPVYCQIHDMVLDLITFLSNEEHFLTRLDGHQSLSLPKKIRRLSLQTDKKEDVKPLASISLRYLRSLTVSGQGFSLLPTLPSLCPFLRVLDLSDCDKVEKQHCKDICNLFHLRYLRLSQTDITELPKEISNLQFLQALDISDTRIKELPPTFIQLKHLLYLHVLHFMTLPDGFGSLNQLQEIRSTITINSPTMFDDLASLSKLRCLNFELNDEWDDRYWEAFNQCLSKLVSLELLEVSGRLIGPSCWNLSPGPQMPKFISKWTLVGVPIWMYSLSSLSSLYITLSTLRERDLQVLGTISSLNDLKIRVEYGAVEYRRKRLVIDEDYPFLSLTQFSVESSIMDVRFEQGAMKKLRILNFHFGATDTVNRFGDFDFGLENLHSLEHIDVCIRYSISYPWEADHAEMAIQRSIHMNPNKPTMKLEKVKIKPLEDTSDMDQSGMDEMDLDEYFRNIR
ncbi:disease resistance protein PIK6-NP-like [Oryza glaberrima]|uniref:disease resistance protein PIK6-NP-like n=1 Tax=Oryza glaberrima TaxID=4538 RepID=UPI00224C5BEF|nr:disease resistance protein PIK6-NP-like [Oryza glaberrima]